MKVPIKKLNDPYIKVPINSEEHRIDEIKANIARCKPPVCKVEVADMWSEIEE